MTAIILKAFRGKVPRISERALKPNYAVEALNCKISRGRLDPIRGPSLVHTSSLAQDIATMFRYRHGGADNWLVWSRPVDVVRSPTAQDSRGRLFFTGDGEPRMTSQADAISGGGPYPAAWFVLGVYAPTVAPTTSVTGGTGDVESRAYLYTLRTQYDEESAPSPAKVQSGFINGTWNLSGMELPPPNSGTVSGAATVATGVVEVTMDTTRGLFQHEEVKFSGVVGMTDLNGTFAITSVVSNTKVRIALATSQTYSSGGSWARAAPHNLTGMKRCIYRTVGTNTDYKLVAEIDATTTSYDDTVAATALGRNLPTLASDPPPKNGHSLVALANGSLAMLAGNELCISEQYMPYSWPRANRYAFAGTGVALGAAGNSLIVLTDTYPVEAVATVPEAASLSRLPTYAPCVAKLGAVDIGGGIAYPSHDGLYVASPGGMVRNATEGLYRYDEWQAMNPATFKAAFFDQKYYAHHDGLEAGTSRLLVLDTAEPDSVTEVQETAGALYANPLDGKLYISKANKIHQWDADDSRRFLASWRSMDFQFGPAINFACAQVHAEYSQIAPLDTSAKTANQTLLDTGADAIEGALGASDVGMYPLGASNLKEAPAESLNTVQFALMKDGTIIFSRSLTDSRPFRVPAGARGEVYAILVSASVPVHSAYVAQSMSELAQVSV